MGGQLAREQEQLKNMNCTRSNTNKFSHGEGAVEALQKLQQD